MKNNVITENKKQDKKSAKGKSNYGDNELPVATPATDIKINLAKNSNGLNQANTINNDLEPGDRKK